ncbi:MULTISPECIES: hypothetical protein [unclassified Endozoicomonas]|uniref:hypothetical protein n=1 Tax=unclassified Endozoicomonas TaxID=2644528 RepID=UPI003BB4A597
MSFLNPNDSAFQHIEHEYRQIQQQSYTRLQAGRARIGLIDSKSAVIQKRNMLQIKFSKASSLEEFNALQSDLNLLDTYIQQTNEIEQKIMNTPVHTPRNIEEEVNREIKGLFLTGRFEKKDLATLFHVSESHVSNIT